MKKVDVRYLLACAVLAGCTLQEAEPSGEVCPPILKADGYVDLGSVRCYRTSMEGECLDDEGQCIKTAACSECQTDYRECLRYQRDFEALAMDAQKSGRLSVSHVNGDSDLSAYASLFGDDGRLNKCPPAYPYCVWDKGEDGAFLDFACIQCKDAVCGMSCVDLKSDSMHCGACGNACGNGTMCVGGECVCTGGQILCAGRCISPESDDEYCGASGSCTDQEAGIRCLSNEHCIKGVCTAGVVSECDENSHYYYGECVEDSLENCGVQGNNCTRLTGWRDGICVSHRCVMTGCVEGYHLSGNECIADTASCCGAACEDCGSGRVCDNGACATTCTEPLVMCGAADGVLVCVNTQTSLTDCGGCGNVCTTENVAGGASVSCVQSRCAATSCETGYHWNDGVCEQDDTENCGSHGYACAAAKSGWLDGRCELQACVATACMAGYHLSDGVCVADTSDCCGPECLACTGATFCSLGVCTSTCSESQQTCEAGEKVYCASVQSDNDNCGSCGMPCDVSKVENSTETTCVGGVCEAIRCAVGYHPYEGVCEADTVEHCGVSRAICGASNADNRCTGGACVFDCRAGYHLYDGACEADSVAQCGAHNNRCDVAGGWAGGVCEAGKCRATSCAAGYHLNAGVCVADSNDCCGESCAKCSGVLVCNQGSCQGSCSDGQTTCTGDRTYCANLDSDMNSCGACGAVCSRGLVPNSVTVTCSSGRCLPIQCASNAHLYNDTCEIDSADHCGSHNVACRVANANNACVNGNCEFTCKSNAHRYETVCEPDTADNCGGHGRRCNVANADNTCENGSCRFTCNAGYHEYEGCTEDSLEHCGRRNVACNVQNATNYCTGGKCSFECKPGYHKYNGGCEPDSVTDCGSHGNACATRTNMTASCPLGECVYRCESGYHPYDGGCEANSNDNCGNHGVACSASLYPNAMRVSCSTGTCKILLCDLGYTPNPLNTKCLQDGTVVKPVVKCGNQYPADCNGDGSKCCPTFSDCNKTGATMCLMQMIELESDD